MSVAIQAGYSTGQVLEAMYEDDEKDEALRIAFDFDGVRADDGSETVMQTGGLDSFREHEVSQAKQPLLEGPLKAFLVRISKIQSVEERHWISHPDYRNRLRVSIVTARNAPLHERAMNTLTHWSVIANDEFF